MVVFPLIVVVGFVGSSASELVLEFVFTYCLTRDLNRKINPWWTSQAKTLSNASKIKLVDVKDLPLLMRCVSLEVRSIAILCTAVEVIVFLDQLHELILNISKLAIWELKLIWVDLLLLEES